MPKELSDFDKLRIRRYGDYRKLFKGKHFEVFQETVTGQGIFRRIMSPFLNRREEQKRKREELIYTAVNMPALVSKVSADFLFLEPLQIEINQENEPLTELLDEILERDNVQLQLYEGALTNSAKGDLVYKINLITEEDGKQHAKVEPADPKLWFPRFGRGVRDVVAHDFYVPFTIDNRWYLLVERHTAGKIQNMIFTPKDKKIQPKKVEDFIQAIFDEEPVNLENDTNLEFFRQAFPDLEPEVDTGVDFMLVEHIPNLRLCDEYFGQSDYQDAETLFEELDNRLSQVARVLDKHADPKMQVPAGVVNDDGEAARGDFELIEVEGDGKDVKYITWEGNLDASFAHIDKLVNFIFMVTETSKAAFGENDGSAESGTALRLRLVRTLAKIARKRLYYDPALKSLLIKTLKVEASLGNIQSLPDNLGIEITWPDGLPDIEQEKAINENMKISGGLTSIFSAIQRLTGWNDERVQEEIDRIADEKGRELTFLSGQNQNRRRDINLREVREEEENA